MDRPFQRIGALSNTQVGGDFEGLAQRFFKKRGLDLRPRFRIAIGVGAKKKEHSFDLGCEKAKILVECKSHRWTAGHNVPSAKMTVWNEAMYYFSAAPMDFKKILFVLRDLRRGDGESLASFYFRTYEHLVPQGVEIWEYDEGSAAAMRVSR